MVFKLTPPLNEPLESMDNRKIKSRDMTHVGGLFQILETPLTLTLVKLSLLFLSPLSRKVDACSLVERSGQLKIPSAVVLLGIRRLSANISSDHSQYESRRKSTKLFTQLYVLVYIFFIYRVRVGGKNSPTHWSYRFFHYKWMFYWKSDSSFNMLVSFQ